MDDDTPALPGEIKMRAIGDLIPHATNSRTHSEEQIAQLVASMQEFGFTNPVLISADSGIIAGHGRILAAVRLGMTEVPTIELGHLTPTQIKAYVIADNQLALNAGWNPELLALEIGELLEEGFEIKLLGFKQIDIDSLLRTEENEDPIPAVPKETDTQIGDVYQLGAHRLMCGDATEADHVATLLNGVEPHLMVTDPPYGVEYDPEWRADVGVNKNRAKMGAVQNDDRADWREAWALFPGNVAYVWHGALHAGEVADSLVACGFTIRSQIIWSKDRFALSRGDYHWQHEPCWYAVKGSGAWNGSRKQSTVWTIPAREDSGHGHSTQKPIDCMKRPIENNSSTGQAIYEPLCGSGTTILAAEYTGRCCYAMEINPLYVDVAIERWENRTNKKAVKLDG